MDEVNINRSISGYICTIRLVDGTMLYNLEVLMVVTDISVNPLYVKLQNGSIINWKSVAYIMPVDI